jgi:1,4-alpha-glucan branching enzyme
VIRDLNHFYRNEPAMYEADYERGGFMWLDHSDYQRSVYAMLRRNKTGDRSVLVVGNFTPTPVDGYRLGVPETGTYQVVLNTDSSYYWGSDYDMGGLSFQSEAVTIHGQAQSILINLPPLATVFIKRIGD